MSAVHPSAVVVANGQSHLGACDAGGIVLTCCGSHGIGEALGMPSGSRCECACHRTRYLTGEANDTAHLTAVVGTLARQVAGNGGVPLWSVLGDLIGCGSGMAARVVRRLGFDPETSVLKPSWYDPTKTSVQGWCERHQSLYDLNDECNDCATEREGAADVG